LRLLLDTHALLWFVLDDARLSSVARSAIEASDNELYISPASFWEIAIKISLGKYKLKGTYEAFWDHAMDGNNITTLPIEIRHTARLLEMPYHHKDPFDRLIIAQSLAEHLSIVSGDQRFDTCGVSRVW